MGTAVTGDLIPLLDPNGSSQYVVGRNNSRDIRVGLLGSLFQVGSDGFTPRPGVLVRTPGGSDLFVAAQATPNGSVIVRKGIAIIPRTGQGAYLFVNEADLTVTMPAASTINPRIDIVCAAAYDKGNFGADAFHGPQIEVVQGVVGASPVAPATPAGMLKLADVFRAVNDNAISTEITDKRFTTSLIGGIRVSSSMDPSDTNIGAQYGEFRDTGAALERYSGSAWTAVGMPYGSTGCRYWCQTTQQTFSAMTKLVYPTVLQSTPLVTASGTNNTDFTVNRAGWYHIAAGGRYGAQTSDSYWVLRRGTTEIFGQNYPARQFGIASVSLPIYCAVGDSFNYALGPSASVTTTPVGEIQSFSMKYLGDG